MLSVKVSGSKEVLMERMKHRKGHFFAPKMLESQLATLERYVEPFPVS